MVRFHSGLLAVSFYSLARAVLFIVVSFLFGVLFLETSRNKRNETCLRLAFAAACLQLAFTSVCLQLAFTPVCLQLAFTPVCLQLAFTPVCLR